MWCDWEKRNAKKIFGGKHERKEPLGRAEHKLEDDIKMDLKAIGQGGMDLFVWRRIEKNCSCCELNNKPLGFIL